jgi:hypothetical protein
VKATERDEVESFRSLESLQAVGHGDMVIPERACAETRSSR